MRRALSTLVWALSLAGAGLAHAAPGGELPWLHERVAKHWMFLAPIELELALGGTSGWETRADSGGLVDGAVAIAPQIRWRKGRFSVRTPLAFSQRLTVGLDLPETVLSGGLELSGRPWRWLTLEAGGDVERTWRLGWDDLYQPLLDATSEPTGDVLATDRYGGVTATAAIGATWKPDDGLSLSLDGRVRVREDDIDPAFDPVLAPTHLTPASRTEERVRLKLKTEPIERLHVDVALAAEAIDYAFAFARDAGTGLTHANVGGTAANPLQSLLLVSLTPDVSWWWAAAKTRLSFELRLAHQEDTFQGYYTWDAIGGELAVRVRPTGDWKIEARYDLELRGYTHDGYREGPDHPALEGGGAVRERVRHEVGLDASVSFAEDLFEAFVELRWIGADDTMPDYQPWVFPADAPYAVDFDVDWWTARLGLRAEL